MKQLILAFAIILSISISAIAQTTPKDVKNDKQKTELKAHVCTAACKNGKHVYAHSEKGHVCTKECKMKM